MSLTRFKSSGTQDSSLVSTALNLYKVYSLAILCRYLLNFRRRLIEIDIPLLDAFRHFNRERIPERVLHAKGAGAHGFFLPTADLSEYTIAHPFQPENLHKKVPVTARFSTVSEESGSADTIRTFRGFALKLKTEVGNWDWGAQAASSYTFSLTFLILL